MTKGKKTILGIGITLVSMLVLAGIIVGIIFGVYALSGGNNPQEVSITYDRLKTVMQNDVVYLSEDFYQENDLIFSPTQPVTLYYSRGKVKSEDFTQRVKNVESYSYSTKSSSGMSIAVGVVGKSDDDDSNYNVKSYIKSDGGYKYGYSNYGKIVYDNKQLWKLMVVKTTGRRSLVNKKSCLLCISVSIAIDDSVGYTDGQIIAKFDEIFASALKHIERYGN